MLCIVSFRQAFKIYFGYQKIYWNTEIKKAKYTQLKNAEEPQKKTFCMERRL